MLDPRDEGWAWALDALYVPQSTSWRPTGSTRPQPDASRPQLALQRPYCPQKLMRSGDGVASGGRTTVHTGDGNGGRDKDYGSFIATDWKVPVTWYDNDRFWTEFYEHVFSTQRAEEAEQILNVSDLFQFPRGARVLDVCCGPGLFAVPLAQRGYEVTGIDYSSAMLAQATRARQEAEVNVHLIHADAREYVQPGTADVALNLFTSFGYFDDHADNMRVLRNMHDCLVPGGQLVLDVTGKELFARTMGHTKTEESGDVLVVKRDTPLDDWTRLRSDWVLVSGGQASKATLTMYIYSAAELRAMLEEAGFTNVQCFGNYFGAPYDVGASRLVVSARRSASGDRVEAQEHRQGPMRPVQG